MTLPLAGLRVLDLSTVVAGPFGSEILGELGAEVIRVDPPAAAKPLPQHAPGTPVSDAEGFTWALQRNKRSICLDLKSSAGRAAFLALVARCDVVYENFRPGVMQRLGLDLAALRAANPRIVLCSISGFGQHGPWAEVGAYDVAVQALGGAMSFTGTGDPDDDLPCRLGVPVGDLAGALYAVIGTLASLAARDRQPDRPAPALDVSLLDVQLALNTYRVPQAFGGGLRFAAASPRRGGAGTVPYGPFQAGDGAWLVIGVASNFWPAFCEALERPGWLADARFTTLALRQQHQAALEALVEARLRDHDAAHWVERLAAAGVPVGRVNQVHEAFAHPQAVAREAVVRFIEPSGRVVCAAASPLRFVDEPRRPQRAPVATGHDTEAVLAELQQPHGAPPRVEPAAVDPAIAALAALPGGPLAGTLVLELCGDEPSGTFGTQILADLGATVLKIERPPAGDPAPLVELGDAPVPEAIAYAYGLNRNKRSLCLDLKSEAGRAALLQLVDRADVVYDNHKPGTLAKLGLDAATLRARRPALVCCSVSGYGPSGPWRDQPAYDATLQAAGGAMSLTGTGTPGSAPVRWGNPIGGIGGALYAVIGILAALRRRARSGEGATLDIALFDVQLALHAYRVPPALSGARYTATPHRGGSGALPYGPFRCADGRWFVLGITGRFWARACEAFGRPAWIDDPRLKDEPSRQAHEPLLNALVGEAMRQADADEWQRRFVALGIPGAQVVDLHEAFAHPHVALRGMLAGFDADPQHPVARRLKVAGSPLRYDDRAIGPHRPVPGLGADTRAVLTSLAGQSPAQVDALRAARAAWWPAQGEVLARPSVV